MYTVNFTCEKSKANRANLSKITLWINIDGIRSNVKLDLMVNPDEFKKSIFSKRQNHITRYCSTARQKVDEFYTLLDEYIELAKQRVGTEIGKATYCKYTLAVEQLKEVIPNKPGHFYL